MLAKSSVTIPTTPAYRLFVGTSGWAYPTWKPGFYPKEVSARNFLGYYSSRLTSVEVNYTFSSPLKPGQLQGWLDQTPPHFRFSFKAPQQMTHFARLRDCEAPLASFLESLLPAAAAGKLGAILFQLPPNFKVDLPRLADFLALHAFEPLAPSHIAFEFRHPSWFNEETYTLLHAHAAALCIAESDDLQTPEVHTASTHLYFRLRRSGGYKPRQTAGFAEHFHALCVDETTARDIYIYHKHEDAPTGALNALALLRDLTRRGRRSAG